MDGDGHVQRGRRRAGQRPAHGADAVAGVEAGHDRSVQALLDRGGLDVHRHVPPAGREAQEEQPCRQHGDPGVMAGGDHE